MKNKKIKAVAIHGIKNFHYYILPADQRIEIVIINIGDYRKQLETIQTD